MSDPRTDSGSADRSADLPTLDLSSPQQPDHEAGLGAWLEKVAGELGVEADAVRGKLGRTTAEGVHLGALYTEHDVPTAGDPAGLPGVTPFTRGTRLPSTEPSWTLGQLVDDPRPAEANETILRDLQLGAQMLWLRVDRAGRMGLDADDPGARGKVGCGGVRWGTPVEIEALLQGVEPRYVPLVVDAGGGTPAAAALFLDWARRKDVSVGELRGGFVFDPYASLAEDGEMPGHLGSDLGGAFARAADLARYCRAEAPGLRALAVSTRPYHDAGAGQAQQLGFGLAAAVSALRRYADFGLDPAAVASQLVFVHSVGSETFLEIAKLRAARLLWSKVLKAAGGLAGAAQQSHIVFGSDAATTIVDPWVNLLRSTSQTFAAVVGGADAMIPTTFDRRLGTSSDLARRIAVTTQHVLGEESHLRRVADPAGGSWTLEALTDRLARRSWRIFREIEAAGGYEAAYRSGAVAERIAETVDRRRKDVARRKDGLVGLSVFPQLSETRPELDRPDLDALALHAVAALESIERPDVELPEAPSVEDLIEAAGRGATLGALTSALASLPAGDGDASRWQPLDVFRPAAIWERLRLATDEYAKARGERPKIFLANLGAPSEHRTRTEFAAGFFAAAGIEPVDVGECEHAPCSASAFRASGARAAVLCSSDERYAELAIDAARELKAAGAIAVYLAGRPGEHEGAWRAAGIDDFVYVGCDAHASLRDLLVSLEVVR